jgi:hypothetical protein
VEGGFCFFSVRGGGVEEGGESFAEACPGSGAEGHEGVQGWELAGGFEVGGKEVGFGAGVQVEEMGAYGYAEVLLVFSDEGSVGKVRQGEVGRGVVGVGEPALVSLGRWLGHAG